MRTYDVAVVGAGYVGCAVACGLAVAGLKTALLDQGSVPGGASRANYGSVQVQDAELAHSLPMVTAGHRGFERLEEELGCSVGFRRLASLLVIESEAQWHLMARRVAALRLAGIQAELVEAERLPEVEPLLDQRAVLGGCYHPDEGQVSPFALDGCLSAPWQAGRAGCVSVHGSRGIRYCRRPGAGGVDISGAFQRARTSC